MEAFFYCSTPGTGHLNTFGSTTLVQRTTPTSHLLDARSTDSSRQESTAEQGAQLVSTILGWAITYLCENHSVLHSSVGRFARSTTSRP